MIPLTNDQCIDSIVHGFKFALHSDSKTIGFGHVSYTNKAESVIRSTATDLYDKLKDDWRKDCTASELFGWQEMGKALWPMIKTTRETLDTFLLYTGQDDDIAMVDLMKGMYSKLCITANGVIHHESETV